MTSVIAGSLAAMKRVLRRVPLLLSAKRAVSRTAARWVRGEATTLNLVHAFPQFTPNSAGDYELLARLTVQSINETLPELQALAAATGAGRLQRLPMQSVPVSARDLEAAGELKQCLDRYGSDKANHHDYHLLYGRILADKARITAICEVGLGTNNVDVPSNMGVTGTPGASLRGFRDYLPTAKIYGADVDTRILFEEDRIKTFHVDQTDAGSFVTLGESVPGELDMFIDDGLHSPSANITTLRFALTKIKIGGWVVVEDIGEEAFPVWEVAAALLPASHETFLIKCEKEWVFAVRRVS